MSKWDTWYNLNFIWQYKIKSQSQKHHKVQYRSTVWDISILLVSYMYHKVKTSQYWPVWQHLSIQYNTEKTIQAPLRYFYIDMQIILLYIMLHTILSLQLNQKQLLEQSWNTEQGSVNGKIKASRFLENVSLVAFI